MIAIVGELPPLAAHDQPGGDRDALNQALLPKRIPRRKAASSGFFVTARLARAYFFGAMKRREFFERADRAYLLMSTHSKRTRRSRLRRVLLVAQGSASLNWVAPTENTDGSALTDLAIRARGSTGASSWTRRASTR